MPVAIRVEDLSKAYQLGQIGTGTLSQDLQRWWAIKRGKEDPFLRIGEVNDRTSVGKSNIVWSLKDINFDIQQGDAVGIIGRNGAGKSTLLKLLSRVTAPTTGIIKARGRIASLLEVGTGFHPELTGKENIYLNGAILGMRKKEIDRKLEEIIDFSGVERYVDTPVKRYSSGMYVRLAFAVAAYLDNEILIVDEVLAVGDVEFQKKCLGKLGDVSKGEGRTVLFVSHNLQAIEILCQKGIYLLNGSISKIGTSREVINAYLNEARPNFSFGIKAPVRINQYFQIEAFYADKNPVRTFDDVNFILKCSFPEKCVISSICILIYNELNERIAIIDLREIILANDLRSPETISLSIKIDQFNLVDGEYNIGLYVSTDTFEGDFFDLWRFVIDNKVDSIISYDKKARGCLELRHQVELLKS